MTEQSQTPLIGPLKQRGWREIVRFRPISDAPHAALVVVRQGRLVGVIPADARRVLSDYVSLPFEFHEVDMRERLLLISQRVESRDAEYAFDATIKLIYQVVRPERVALELQDALSELEDVLTQSLRATSRSFGVEQFKTLEENLREALFYGDVLQSRLAALGLALRRADIVIDLDERARARAEALREHMRDRPLLVQQAIESLDQASSFDVLVGGSYRLISRMPAPESPEVRLEALQEMIVRTLRRIGIAFAPQDYAQAAEAMGEALRHDSLLLAELAAAELELIRPNVKIQPDRQMVVVAQNTPPALPAPEAPTGKPRTPAWPPELTLLLDAPESTPPWAGLGAAAGREAQPPSFMQPPEEPAAAQPAPVAEISPWAGLGAAAGREAQPPEEPAAAQPAPAVETSDVVRHENGPAGHDPGVSVEAAPDEGSNAAGGNDEPIFSTPPGDQGAADAAAPPEPPPVVSEPGAVGPDNVEIDSGQLDRWLTLLKANSLAMFKLRTLEITAQPDSLPLVLAALTNEPELLSRADDPRYQQALVRVLAEHSTYQPQPDVPQAARPPEPQGTAKPADDTPPDWLRLRRAWRDEGDAE